MVLLFLPLSVSLKATNEAVESTSTATSTFASSTSSTVEEVEVKEGQGIFSMLVKKIFSKIEATDSEDIRSEYSEAKTKIENLQKKVEGILRKLNNTES